MTKASGRLYTLTNNAKLQGNGVNGAKPGKGDTDGKSLWVVHKNGKTFHKFFILKPKEGLDIKNVAKELMELDDVLEVYVTEGSAGFMVKARFDGENEPESVARYIKKNVDNKYGTLVSYLNYSRS